jgi:hypothetical protein
MDERKGQQTSNHFTFVQFAEFKAKIINMQVRKSFAVS